MIERSKSKGHIEMKVTESHAAVDNQYITAFAKADVLTEAMFRAHLATQI
jgi:hypothetical protein